MLRIGEFARLTRISIYMLRHYDEIGLLAPDHIDDITGYRYYTEKQLPQAVGIQALKNMGLGLPAIKTILKKYNNTGALKKYLVLQSSQKKEELHELQKQVRLLESAVSTLECGSSLSDCCITLKEIPARTVMYLRETIEDYDRQGILWAKLTREAAKYNIHYTKTARIAALLYNTGAEGRGIDTEIQKTVIGTYTDIGILQFKTLPAVTVASTAFNGNYYRLHAINLSIKKWISENGYSISGPHFDIYHISPEFEPFEGNFITEVCYPVVQAAQKDEDSTLQ